MKGGIMKNHRKLLPLVMVLTGILSISSCQKFGEGVHETWVEPPKKALADDNTLTSTVKSSLLTDSELSGLDLQVEARAGEIILSGLVKTQSQIDRANTLTWMVEGVKKVDNRMSMK
ncbi:MAG: BON domain-containing protein [Nitrosomonadaceae bacterium]|nr:BON domain-containing protein [Nitrosomonadaceae bacterium]